MRGGRRRPSARTVVLLAAVAALAAGGLVAVSALFAAPGGRDPGPSVPDGAVRGHWRSEYNGEGTNRISGNEVVLAPKASTGSGETHAGLVVSVTVYGSPAFQVELRTDRQLRTPRPNPWEVGWVLWNYTDDQHFYYLALKTSGWELGKEDPSRPGGQRYLATGAGRFPIGRWYRVEVVQRRSSITIRVDGTPLVAYTDGERPYLRGFLGLYSEDAQVRFRVLKACCAGPSASGSRP